MDIQVPIHQKYVLSIDEAALYFHIGVNRLRRLVLEHKNAGWVLWNQTQISRSPSFADFPALFFRPLSPAKMEF